MGRSRQTWNHALCGFALAAFLPWPVASWAAEEGAAAGKPREMPLEGPTEFVLVQGRVPGVPTSNTIATKLPRPLMETPANIGIVESALMEDQDAMVLSDALRDVSGLNIQSQSGVHDFFLIRGFDSLSGALVLTDGASEPEATFYHTYNLERVEVLKGPASFLYGSRPLAGAVNLVRKQPAPGRFFRLGTTTGSFNRREGHLDLNLPGRDGEARFRLNSLWRDSDNYRDATESRDWAVNPAWAWRLGDGTRLNLNLEYVNSDHSPDSGLPILVLDNQVANVSRRRSFQSPFDFSRQDIYRFQLDWETVYSDAFTLRDKLYYRDLDWQSDGTSLGGAFPNLAGGFDVFRTITRLDDRQQFVGNQIEGVFSWTWGAAHHELLAGLEAELLSDDFRLDFGFLPSIDLFQPVETAAAFPMTQPLAAGATSTDIVAPYVVDQIGLGSRWQVLLGARLDLIDFDDDLTGTSRSDSELSPMGGVVFSPADGLSIYANLGAAFAPPSPRVVGDREPEESVQYEVGVKKAFLSGRLQATWAAYRIERDQIAIPDENGFTQQTGDQRSQGLEFELVAEPRPRLRMFLSYAFNDAELTEFAESVFVDPDGPGPLPPGPITFDRSGKDPAFAPDHILNFWVSQRFRSGFGYGAGGRYVSEQFIAEDNRFRLDDYATLDAAVFYDIGRWRWQLNIKNLTDDRHQERGFPSTAVIPSDPITVFLSIGFRL
ncbi:MAG: TonB-dependent receptor [Acidobacteriota bacterium]